MLESADAAPVPAPLRAVTEHRYVLPFVNPETVMGLEALVFEPVTPPFPETHVAV